MIEPFYQEPDRTIYCGHALDILKQMPSNSVDCAITSPPYWGLRTYKTESIIWGDNHCEHEWQTEKFKQHAGRGDCQSSKKYSEQEPVPDMVLKRDFCFKCNAWRGELGLEPTIELYIEHLILIFNEVKRVLKKTGTCWVNLDDSYAGGGRGFGYGGKQDTNKGCEDMPHSIIPDGVPAKSLCLIPQRFAIAMVENDWILRNDICWSKPNPMPESVKDRFTGSWEHLFFFVKSNTAQYWVNEKTRKVVTKTPLGIHGIEGEDWEWRDCPCTKNIIGTSSDGVVYHSKPVLGLCKRCKGTLRIKYSFWAGRDYWFEQQFEPITEATITRNLYPHSGGGEYCISRPRQPGEFGDIGGRNKRDVWQITAQPYPGAHFAVYPEKLCEIPILAGCPSMICKKCGKAREKIYEVSRAYQSGSGKAGNKPQGSHWDDPQCVGDLKDDIRAGPCLSRQEIGHTDCGCNANFEAGVVMDIFAGSGTTGAVAKRLGRKYIGIELNPDYCKFHKKRLQEISLPMALV